MTPEATDLVARLQKDADVWETTQEDVDATPLPFVLLEREAATLIEAQAAEIEGLRKALTRQTENFSFALNRVDLPSQWYARFSSELAEDRAFLASRTERADADHD